ncbi:hypothetical protein ACW9IK_19765 [Pseudomonas gingeri]
MEKYLAPIKADPLLKNRKKSLPSLLACLISSSLILTGFAFAETPRPLLGTQSKKTELSAPEKAQLLKKLSPQSRKSYEKSLTDQQRAQIDKAYRSVSDLKINNTPQALTKAISPKN